MVANRDLVLSLGLLLCSVSLFPVILAGRTHLPPFNRWDNGGTKPRKDLLAAERTFLWPEAGSVTCLRKQKPQGGVLPPVFRICSVPRPPPPPHGLLPMLCCWAPARSAGPRVGGLLTSQLTREFPEDSA